MNSMTVLSESQQQALRIAIQDGLPLTPQPYQTLATALGATEASVMSTISHWQESGLIKRFGLVVKHHTLGYRSNAMVVWNIADDLVDQIAGSLSQNDAVTLCYRRPRKLPEWPFNLFTMIHGKSRSMVLSQLEGLVNDHQLHDVHREVLFSYRLFKQCGGHYSGPSNKLKPSEVSDAVVNPSLITERSASLSVSDARVSDARVSSASVSGTSVNAGAIYG